MKFLSRLIIVLAILIISKSFVQAQTVNKEIKVGVVGIFSGAAALWGDALRNGMLLAHQQLEPQLKNRIKIIFEDDQGIPKNDATAFNKLVNIDQVDVIIGLWSVAANVIAPLAEQKKIPFIALASDFSINKGREWIVNLYVSPEEEAKLAVEEAKKRGYEKIAQIVALDDWGKATIVAFDKVNQGQLEVVFKEEFPQTERDFKSIITKLKIRKDLDAIMLVINPGPCGVFVKQLHQMGMKLPLFAFETFEDWSEVENSGKAIVGHWFVNTANPEPNFVKEYSKRYATGQILLAANGYDAIKLVAEALINDSSKEGIIRYLKTVKDFNGAMGKYSAKGDNTFSIPAAVKVVTEKGFEQVSK